MNRNEEILDKKVKLAQEGGGKKRVENQHAKGKLTARERIDYLIDKESIFFELGRFAAFGMYEEYGGANCSGIISGIGKINGYDFIIIANDATVKAGAYFEVSLKKNFTYARNSI